MLSQMIQIEQIKRKNLHNLINPREILNLLYIHSLHQNISNTLSFLTSDFRSNVFLFQPFK